MSHIRPSSPLSNDLYQGIQRLVQHNATTPARQRLQGGDAISRTLSPQSTYNSAISMQPTASTQLLSPYHQVQDHSSYPELHDFHGANSAGQYTGYGPPPTDYYISENVSHHSFPYTSEVLPSTPATPGLTPSDLARRTRSGRTLVRSHSPQALASDTSRTRVTKSPKVKTPKQKAIALKTPKIDKPLSELTRDMIDVPVRDIEAWVNRSASVRQKEVEKRNGYVTRPMNSFMLYRSAYAERTKMWCLQNNHQVVSSVSGESWPLEPAEVREQYNEYARIERLNHASAHPDYKFQPSKSGPSSPPRRKKQDDFDDDDDEDANDDFSDTERSDSEWKPRSGRSAQRSVRGSSAKRQTAKSPTPVLPSYTDSPMQQHSQLNMFMGPQYDGDAMMGGIQHPSSWAPDSHGDLYGNGHYFPSTILSSSAPSGMLQNNMAYYVPSAYHTNMTSYHPELLRLHSHANTPLPVSATMPAPTPTDFMQFSHTQDAQVDPVLLQLDDNSMLQFEGFEGMGMPSGDGAGGYWPGDGYGAGGDGFGSGEGHFDAWMAGREGP